jgi:hypothetical protein
MHMPFETLNQWVALGLTLIAGWLLGLASSSRGAKWRERYQDLDLEHAGYRDRAEEDLREANRRIRELEAENARLVRDARPVPAAAPVAAAPAVVHSPEQHHPVEARRDGHSTGTVVAAAAAGAVAGAAAMHAANDKDEPEHTTATDDPAAEAPASDHRPADTPPPAAEPRPADDIHANQQPAPEATLSEAAAHPPAETPPHQPTEPEHR